MVLAAGWPWSLLTSLCAAIALAVAWLLHVALLGRSDGDESARAAAAALRARTHDELVRSTRVVAAFALVVLVVLLSRARDSVDRFTAWGFVAGAALAVVAQWSSVRVSLSARARCAEAANGSRAAALETATTGAGVAGLATAGLGLVGVAAFWLLSHEPRALFGVSLGACVVAVVVRRAASGPSADALAVGAAAAETLAAQATAVVAAMAAADGAVRQAGLALVEQRGFVLLPLGLAALGLLASVLARRLARPDGEERLETSGVRGLVGAALLFLVAAFVAIVVVDRSALERLGTERGRPAWGGVAGLCAAVGVGLFAGPAVGNVARRLASGATAAFAPVVLVAAALLVAHAGAGAVGVALAAVGAVALSATTLALAAAVPVTRDVAALDETASSSGTLGRGTALVAASLATFALLLGGSDSARELALEPATLVGVMVGASAAFLLARRRGDDSTRPTSAAMIVPALFAVAAPLAMRRLNGEALGAMLLGAAACAAVVASGDRRERDGVEPCGAPIGTWVELLLVVALLSAQR